MATLGQAAQTSTNFQSLDTRLDTAEADIVALEAADVALDTRLDAIENGVSEFSVTATDGVTALSLADWFKGISKDDDRTLFSSSSSTESESVVTFTRNFSTTAASRVATAIFRNPGDVSGGSDYQNEVQLVLWAGTVNNHRRYIRYLKGSGDEDWTEGVNASSVKILFEETGNQHRFWMEPAALTGDTMINAGGTGAAGRIRLGYHAADTLPQTNVRIHRGGVVAASNLRTIEFDGYNSIIYKYATDGTTLQGVWDGDGDLGIGKANPSYKLDIETAAGSPFRAVWSNGSFQQDAHSCTWTTTGTNASDMLTLTDGDNNSGRAVLRLRGNAGSQEVVFAASNGNVGIRTGSSPTAALDVNSDVVRVRTAKTPSSASATGNAGDICWDSNYVYVCVATDTWKRATLASW